MLDECQVWTCTNWWGLAGGRGWIDYRDPTCLKKRVDVAHEGLPHLSHGHINVADFISIHINIYVKYRFAKHICTNITLYNIPSPPSMRPQLDLEWTRTWWLHLVWAWVLGLNPLAPGHRPRAMKFYLLGFGYSWTDPHLTHSHPYTLWFCLSTNNLPSFWAIIIIPLPFNEIFKSGLIHW